MIHLKRLLSLALTITAAAGLSSCGDNRVTAPAAAPPEAASPSLLGWLLGGWGAPKLLECPASETQQTSAVIGIDGGTVSLGGTSIVLPASAVLSPTKL